jgi:hypothetical protein
MRRSGHYFEANQAICNGNPNSGYGGAAWVSVADQSNPGGFTFKPDA